MIQSTENINALLQKFESKEIRLPELQRKYVWKKTQIKQLLDSIYKDYPTGSILLWETDKEVVERDSAVTLQTKSEFSKKYLLLDGQQRLTTLTLLLLALSKAIAKNYTGDLITADAISGQIRIDLLNINYPIPSIPWNLVFATIFYGLGPESLQGLEFQSDGERFFKGFNFSVQTMSTIVYGEITPRGTTANLVVVAEALVGWNVVASSYYVRCGGDGTLTRYVAGALARETRSGR